MTDPTQLTSSSREDSLNDLELVLRDLTDELIPDFVKQIHNTDPSELENVMTQLVTTAQAEWRIG